MTTSETSGAVESEATRLASVEKELNTLERRLKREARMSTFVTVVVLALLSFYFAYGYREFSKIIQPKEIVSLGAALVDENVSVVREAIQDEVTQSAPVWAEQLSNQAIESVPLVREELEEFAVAQAKSSIEEYVSISEDEFRRVLEENHDQFQNLVNELSGEDEATDEVVAALEEVLNKELGGDMQVAAADILETLELAHEKLVRLGVGEDLSGDERKERQVMMLFRRFQMDEGSQITLGGDSSALSIFTTPLTDLGLSGADDDTTVAPVARKTEPSRVALAPAQPKPVSEPHTAPDAAAEAAAQKNVALQVEAVKAAHSATEQARIATKEARDAIAEARKARDELRAAEKDARAAIQELVQLQKKGESKPEVVKPEVIKPADETPADETPADKDSSATEDDDAETPKNDPEVSEKAEGSSSDESS
ncbi:MAG: hypothetical protein P8K08_18915 [Fuerstiella sp.]|jgi:hypothetical protein|nr:hypothetical protein [Fuerstiella sp.]